MRRFFLAIAVIPLALGLAGCGATSGLNDPTTTRPYPNTVEGTRVDDDHHGAVRR